MGQNFQHSVNLYAQIRECYGKVAYTHKTHEKCADLLETKSHRIKITQIVLSTITTGGFLFSIFGDNQVVSIFGIIASSVLLFLTLYYKDFNLEETAEKHKAAALKLWDVRESYFSLLVDFELLGTETVVEKRDALQNELLRIYEQSPRTNQKGYGKAQEALKENEELTFSDEEIDCMLPKNLRKTDLI